MERGVPDAPLLFMTSAVAIFGTSMAAIPAISSNRVGCAARSRARVGCGPFPRSLPPNPVGTFQCAGLSSDCAAFATELRPLPAVVAEDFQYRPGILHYAYLTVPLTSVTCAPSPCGPALPVSRIGRALLLRLLRALCRHRTRVPQAIPRSQVLYVRA